MTRGQINLWRADVRQATLAALRERRPLSPYTNRDTENYRTAMSQVLRAMFIAKVDGEEYSRWPRRR